jgi:hypothetical protein
MFKHQSKCARKPNGSASKSTNVKSVNASNALMPDDADPAGAPADTSSDVGNGISMPELHDLQLFFSDGKTHTLRSLSQRFECDAILIEPLLTRANGFSKRLTGKTIVFDWNPLLLELAATETEAVQ